MAVISGQAATFTVGGTLNGKAEGWEINASAELLETTGCGDDWKERILLHKDYEIRLPFLMLDAAAYNTYFSSLGTAVVWALKRKTSDSAAAFTGTGILESMENAVKFDEGIHVDLVIKCNGTGPTEDTTPA